MKNSEKPKESEAIERGRRAESLLADIFEQAGWRVEREPYRQRSRLDMIVRRPGVVYAVEVKAAVEGRGDRLVPLFAQAVLQSLRGAGKNAAPLAVVAAPKISQRAADQVLKFAEHYAPDAAAGVIDFEGLRLFRGPHLDGLNAETPRVSSLASKSPRVSGHLFSDLNQWMLKVLLAPEVPEELLSAPRGQYRNASQLAGAAKVSVMSAFRFVQQLQAEGYLSESNPYLSLVRREDLFRRWQASAVRSVKEVPMRYLLKGDPRAQLRKMLGSGRACLALFAAADALKLGFVEGVPPYVYVERIQPSNLSAWKNLRRCGPIESPELILRQAPAPQSIFRGLVRPNGMATSDVLQVWVDVSSHPSRGREQADLIRKRVLERVIKEKR
ncbi:MAG: RpiR family transcriptional regulator [Acidobacteria bacterium]|nr:RpiR family transcriptional regulator [Acidobacteriota bacterium]